MKEDIFNYEKYIFSVLYKWFLCRGLCDRLRWSETIQWNLTVKISAKNVKTWGIHAKRTHIYNNNISTVSVPTKLNYRNKLNVGNITELLIFFASDTIILVFILYFLMLFSVEIMCLLIFLLVTYCYSQVM